MPVLIDDPEYEAPELDPLYRAVSNDQLDEVKRLLDERAPREQTRFFELGVAHGAMRVTRFFLERGENADGALIEAVGSGRVEMLDLLLSAGARLTAANSSRLLSATGNPQMYAALVKRGLDAKAETHRHTILMAVCEQGDLESARALLDRGADLDARTKYGSPLTMAEGSGHRVLVDFLLERGAKPEGQLVEPDAERDALLAEATQNPSDSTKRLAWARWLEAHGYRAAAARELQAAKDDRTVTLENPPGTWWRVCAFADDLQRVSPLVADAWFPRALVSDGTRTLPLVVVLNSPCTRCDENGETVCSDCNGTGEAENYLTGRSYACPPRVTCFSCKALEFTVWSLRFAKGACSHPSTEREFEREKLALVRCTACGLAALDFGYSKDFACGACGHLECRCSTSRPVATPTAT